MERIRLAIENFETKGEWPSLIADAQESIPEQLFIEPWTNGKWYQRSRENDPCVFHQPLYPSNAPQEIPAERNIFRYYKEGRFALSGKPITYLASNDVVCAAEITDCFRKDACLSSFMGNFSNYLEGKFNPTPEWFIHTRQFFITKDSLLLDLRNADSLPSKSFAKFGGWAGPEEFHQEIINNREENVYPVTQIIAEASYMKGFRGVLYTSVRMPKDNVPEPCVVIFEEDVLMPYSYNEWLNLRRVAEEQLKKEYEEKI